MLYDLTSLRLFRAVARIGSIARAAEAERIAPSAVSKRMSELEHVVGVPLLRRQRRGVEPTEAGAELLRHVDGVLRRLERLDADMADFRKGLRGHVRLAANTSAITQFLPEDLAAFAALAPDIRIELREATSDEILAWVRGGETDIGLLSGMIDVMGVEKAPYRRDTLVAIAPDTHPIAQRDAVTLDDLVACDLVGLQSGSSLQGFLEDRARERGLPMVTRVEVTSFDGVRRMVEAGLGVAVLPLGAAEPYAREARLKVVAIDESWAERTLYLVVAEGSLQRLSPPARALMKHLLGEV